MNVKFRMTGSQCEQINGVLCQNRQSEVFGLCGQHKSGSDVHLLVHEILGRPSDFKFDEVLCKAKKREFALVRFFPQIVSPGDNTLPKYLLEGIPYADIEIISDKEFKGIYWANLGPSAAICQFMIVGDDITIPGAVAIFS